MFFSALIAKIRDRLLADNGSGGLGGSGTPLPGGINSVIPVAGTIQRPYATIMVDNAPASGFARGSFECTVSITVWANHQNQVDTAWNAVDRIFGDWFATNPPASTRGLHGWKIGSITVTGFTVSAGELIFDGTSHQIVDESTIAITTRYRVTLTVGA